MRQLTDEQLEDAIRYRPYVRRRHRLEMGWFNLLLVILTFVGGSIAYQPGESEPLYVAAGDKIIMEPNGSLPALSEEQLVAIDGTQ